ncbi:MAG: DUF115 domain-containing protein [Spirochaetaceae bacterium]|jgi:hypothetical protein|nr:DUF115 domain-containing protein [Spirochaetaceae bacterium]
MNHWDNNRKILNKNFPGLEKILSIPEEDFESQCVVEAAASDLPTLRARGLYVHSKHDPVKEARRIAASIPEGEEPLVLLGFGLGYLAEAASGRIAHNGVSPDDAAEPGPLKRPLIIVEKHPSLIRRALEERDLGNFLSSKGLIFVIGGSPEGIAGPLELFELPPLFIKNRALVELDGDWYGQAESFAAALLQRKAVNKATLKKFGRRWVRNLGKNKEAIRDLPGIAAFAGAGKAFPALLAAAGPSLDRIAAVLPALKERCIIVAVDTSLRFLLENKVEPDFTVTVDPQYWNDRHLDRVGSRGGKLIAESAVYPPSLRQGFRQSFLCSSLFPLGRFIEDRVEAKGLLGAGGSVATSAWDFARLLGCGEIWIAGLDLGFPDSKSHFRGALFEEQAVAAGMRLYPAETRFVKTLLDGRPFFAPAMDGGQVLTDKRLSLYATWFERQFSRYREVKNYSLSPRGLSIKGLIPGNEAELLSRPPLRKAIDAALDAPAGILEKNFFSKQAREERAEKYRQALRELLAELEHITELSREAAKDAREGWKNASLLGEAGGEARRKALLSRLEAAGRSISESQGKDVAGFLFPPIEDLEEKLTSPASNPLRRHLELSWRLYEALAEAADYSRLVLENNALN